MVVNGVGRCFIVYFYYLLILYLFSLVLLPLLLVSLSVNFFKFHKKHSALKWIYIHAIILLSVLYCGCHNSTPANNTSGPSVKSVHSISAVNLLIGNGTNLFRTIDLGADYKTVLNSEKRIPDENDTSDISYTMPMDTLHPDSVNEPIDSVNYFTITYFFHKEQLNEVDEEVFLPNDSLAANLLERLTDYLSSKYGDYASQNDSRVWNTKHNGKKEWITLSDQSEEYDTGKLLLVLYSEEY